eukprot:gene4227-7564_t
MENKTNKLSPTTLSPLNTFLAGASARCTAAIIMFPVDLIKTRLQFQRESNKMIRTVYKNGFHAFKSILKTEGFLALYKGLPIRLIYITPAAAVSFTVYEQFKQAVTGDDTQNNLKNVAITLTAGFCARIFGTAIRTPFDMLKQQLQVENQINSEKKGLVYSIKLIKENIGYKGFLTGYQVTILRDAPFAAVYFTTYELMKNNMNESQNSSLKPFQHFISGAVAGAIATTCTISVDVVKTRLQTQSRLGTKEYDGIIDAFKKIFKQEGIQGLTKGLGARLIYIMPASAMTFTFFEYFKKKLLDK